MSIFPSKNVEHLSSPEGSILFTVGRDFLGNLEQSNGLAIYGSTWGPDCDQQIDWVNSLGFNILGGFAAEFSFEFSADYENALLIYDHNLRLVCERRNYSLNKRWIMPASMLSKGLILTAWNRPGRPPTAECWRSSKFNLVEMPERRIVVLSWHDLPHNPSTVRNSALIISTTPEAAQMPPPPQYPPYEYFMQGRVKAPQVPPTRYNRWCEKKTREIIDEDKYNEGQAWLSSQKLSDREIAVWTTRFLTESDGIEFVAFTNLESSNEIVFDNGLTLVPCHFPSQDLAELQRHPLGQRTLEMRVANQYVYDGWFPLKVWTPESVRLAIREIGESLSVFALRGSINFSWEPKYPSPERASSFIAGSEEIEEFRDFFGALNSLDKLDRNAVFRSLNWFSQSLEIEDPGAKLLFSVLTIESLVDYIEGVEPTSPFHILQSESLSKAQRRARREECIQSKLDELGKESKSKLTNLITSAYFDCVTPIKRKLMSCLTQLYGEKSQEISDFFDAENAFYGMRNGIAHGSIDLLDDSQYDLLIKRAYDAESFARDFLFRVLEKSLGVSRIRENTAETGVIFPGPDKGTNVIMQGGQFIGPTHMALIY